MSVGRSLEKRPFQRSGVPVGLRVDRHRPSNRGRPRRRLAAGPGPSVRTWGGRHSRISSGRCRGDSGRARQPVGRDGSDAGIVQWSQVYRGTAD